MNDVGRRAVLRSKLGQLLIEFLVLRGPYLSVLRLEEAGSSRTKDDDEHEDELRNLG